LIISIPRYPQSLISSQKHWLNEAKALECAAFSELGSELGEPLSDSPYLAVLQSTGLARA